MNILNNKKRIIFVDDEASILSAYRRIFMPYSDIYICEFESSPLNAIERIKQNKYDLVVSDIFMPEMHGFEFLRKCIEISPDSLRIVVSGLADTELVLNSLKVAHQYLLKPSDMIRIFDIVSKLFEVNSIFEDMTDSGLFLGEVKLPSLPIMYSSLVAELAKENFSIDSAADIVASDMSMTAKILRVVNSSYFGLRRDIRTAKEALIYLGTEAVKTMVLAVEFMASIEIREDIVPHMELLWDHSLVVGTYARKIALSEGVYRIDVDNAFTSGVLHDLGKLMFMSYFPDKYISYTKTAADTNNILSIESITFGFNHYEFGAYLLKTWGLPGALIEPVLFHHSKENDNDYFSVVKAVHFADYFAHLKNSEKHYMQRYSHDTVNGIKSFAKYSLWHQACLKD